ncbi:hypothetical protein HanPSC8_Chr04g0186121 [Helianthus annuus]|nr:hypothetical protein HanPSC8_Chr04g0186121 [Helianthus annuus]
MIHVKKIHTYTIKSLHACMGWWKSNFLFFACVWELFHPGLRFRNIIVLELDWMLRAHG